VGSVIKLRGLVEFAHLAYENTWEKLDRQFLSGDEPTLRATTSPTRDGSTT